MAEVTARTGVPCDQHVESTPLNRAADALRSQETFDRDQVAWLMSQAQRWGYDIGYEDGQRDERELASIAAAYASTSSFSAEATARDIKKRNRRKEADAAARLPRPGDFRGREGQADSRVAA